MIQKLELGGTQKRFDGKVENHYHIRCIGGGCIEDVPTTNLTNIEHAVRGTIDYEIIGIRVEFIGICPQCKEEP
jgi:Fur family ferric uptake transcriptional regulator